MHEIITTEKVQKTLNLQALTEKAPDISYANSYLKFRRFIEVGGLLLLSPFIILTSIIISAMLLLTNKGSIFFVQTRVGKDFKLFNIYKFKTMINLPEIYDYHNSDKYVTKIGKLLRKYRLDELPQVWNIIKGDMSLIGPRPEIPYLFNKFKKHISAYSHRSIIRPGLTGFAQVHLPHSQTIEGNKTKTEYDLKYLNNISFRTDFLIILKTFITVLSGKGK